VHVRAAPAAQPVCADVDLPAVRADAENIAQSLRIEKRLEQLAFLVKDKGDDEDVAVRCRALLSDLQQLGVQV
jgi:hypothetical protein